jgi:AcrR family transcriptional regulator
MVRSDKARNIAAMKPACELTARRQQIRDRLLAAGGRLIASRGLGQVSVADILTEAGVSRRTFYCYFSNKHELAAAVIEGALRAGTAMIEGLARQRPAAILPGVVACYRTLWATHRDALLAISSLDPEIRPYIEEAHQVFGAALKSQLARAERAGLLRNGNAVFTFRVISRTAVPLLRIYAEHPEGERLYEESMLALLDGGGNDD